MATLRDELEERVRAALESLGMDSSCSGVSATADSRFGDYQSNAAMVLAKREKQNPRQLAQAIAAAMVVDDIAAPPEVAGAGFLNFRLRDDFLARATSAMVTDARMGVAPAKDSRRIVIDFSAPNVAKAMHVGHIRSTFLGDALSRIARFLGHEVVTDNHIGDWGTQFGKVIYGWKHLLDPEAFDRNPLGEILRLYREVNQSETQDPAIEKAVRDELVRLQSGDATNLEIWQKVVAISLEAFNEMYRALGVSFDEVLGESFYNEKLAPLVERLLAEGIAEHSEGAVVIFFPEIPALADRPCLVRKSDGGFLYATTDLATLEYRVDRWNPDSIWYVTGAPQALHFQQIFAASRKMGYSVDCQHIAFGSILGEDRKIMRTRSGENVQLADVISEAIERAATLISAKNPDISPEELDRLARTIGIGAIKYAELSQHRLTDYIFAWEKMLSLQGNTAPYLQNAYVRIRSIFRRAGQDDVKDGPIILAQPSERALAVKLNQFAEILPAVLDDFRPNLLANYMYELATTFHAFYEECPVLKEEGLTRESRLALCSLTARTLELGLGLLGIEVPDRM